MCNVITGELCHKVQLFSIYVHDLLSWSGPKVSNSKGFNVKMIMYGVIQIVIMALKLQPN